MPKATENQTRQSESRTTEQNLHYDHLLCKCPQTITQTIKVLVDSDADVNFIKVSSLKDEKMIKDQTEQNLSGITGHTLHSFGITGLTLCLGRDEHITEFQMAPSSFLVPYDGILGKPFIIGLETILNYKTKHLILTDSQNPPNLVNPTELPKTFNSVGDSELNRKFTVKGIQNNITTK